MMRGDHNRQWSDPLRDMLTKRDIPAIDVEVVHSTTAFVEKIDIDGVAASDSGRAEFMFETIERFGVGVSGDFRDLAMEVGLRTPFEEGLSHYLNQLEPVTKDLALLTEGVAIMSMQRLRGLRFRGAVVMGVENGVIPSPRAVDSEEERRLLYVAMTRAKE